MADQFIPFSTPAEQDPNQFLNKAIRLVRDEIEFREEDAGEFQVYIISFGYVLGNWKAYLSSSLANGKIYEVSYDRDKRVAYIDTYGKVRNEPVYDEGYTPTRSDSPDVDSDEFKWANIKTLRAETPEEKARREELEERGTSPW